MESNSANSKTLKRPRDILSSDPIKQPPSKSRVTRTDNLLDLQRSKTDKLTSIGNLNHQLLQRWQCPDERYQNHNGWCFIDYSGKHFTMDHAQQSIWAKAITNGDKYVSIERLPSSLYRF